MHEPMTKALIEEAAQRFLELGVGPDSAGCVIIRSGHLGAFVATREHNGRWIDAYWSIGESDKVVDVTGVF